MKREWIKVPREGHVAVEFHSPEWVWMPGNKLLEFEKRAGMEDAADGTQWCLFESDGYVVEDDS